MLFNLAFVVFALSHIYAIVDQKSQLNYFNYLIKIINQTSFSNDDIAKAKEYIELIPNTVLDQRKG